MPTADAFGLDTSVIIRLLTGEPPEQAERALAFVRAEADAGRAPAVSDLVISETYFALQHHFAVPKREALRALAGLFEDGALVPEDGGSAAAVLRRAASGGQRPGFIDRLIHAQYARRRNRLATFERASGRMPRTVVL